MSQTARSALESAALLRLRAELRPAGDDSFMLVNLDQFLRPIVRGGDSPARCCSCLRELQGCTGTTVEHDVGIGSRFSSITIGTCAAGRSRR